MKEKRLWKMSAFKTVNVAKKAKDCCGEKNSEWETDAHWSEAQHWLKLQHGGSLSILPPPPLHPSFSALPISLCPLLTEVFLQAQDLLYRRIPVLSAAILLLWCICLDVDSVFLRLLPVRSWTGPEWGRIEQTGSPANSPDWCRLGRGDMGCTTSTVVFDGLRSVLERNCSGYICKEAAESAGPSEAERALSRRESRALPAQRILKVCLCVCVFALKRLKLF